MRATTAARAPAAASVIQSNSIDLDRSWTRRFVLGVLAKRYGSTPSAEALIEHALQHDEEDRWQYRALSTLNLPSQDWRHFAAKTHDALAKRWKLSDKQLDDTSATCILQLLSEFACGDGMLSEEALLELNLVMRRLPGAPSHVEHPVHMERLLHLMGYCEPGDNIRRAAYKGELYYPPEAEAVKGAFLDGRLQQDGGDPYDALRDWHKGPAYAIDSATTSEVDDAIGVYNDPKTGEEYFVVYVSDATVYCPFDSPLEQLTARYLTTTTYLPEGVYFMLPQPIIEAATLREDRPCRTFNIRFQIDAKTGELKNYSIGVGWLRKMRRITYDQVQALLERQKRSMPSLVTGVVRPPSLDGDDDGAAGGAATRLAPHQQPPAWLKKADTKRLRRIYATARLRFQCRLRNAAGHGKAMIDTSLPEPLIKVKGTEVVSLTDQIVSTHDARLAVAELMIAANEVCSRIAQANGIPLPFRGTRLLSSDHEAALCYKEPQGVIDVGSLDPSYTFLAEAMQHSVRRLSAVTRAVYYHEPLYHTGLDTTFYTHSTSPLRRYADMLVHHQLKVLVWKQFYSSGGGGGRKNNKRGRRSSSSSSSAIAQKGKVRGVRPNLDQPIPEYLMADLCSEMTSKQEEANELQDSSSRYWTLRYVQDLLQQASSSSSRRRFVCFIGTTRFVGSAPAYSRFQCSVEDALAILYLPFFPTPTSGGERSPSVPSARSTVQPYGEFMYVSDVYLPELQLPCTVCHCRPDLRVGVVAECEVVTVMPTQGVLELRLVAVRGGGDERDFESLWVGGVVSHLDA